jgi:DNA polymerase I-like protein with 3'-5' exonuclease and polymerase domains
MVFVGFQLVSFDYSQLELRVLAHLSNDNKLKTCLRNNSDFFITLAANLFKISEYEVTPEQRQNAKQVKNIISIHFNRNSSLDLLWYSLWYVKRNICS